MSSAVGSDDSRWFHFPADSEGRIRGILGAAAFDLALPGLALAAGLYAIGRESGHFRRGVQTRVKRELERVDKCLARLQGLDAHLSSHTARALERTYDKKALLRDESTLTGSQALSLAIEACNQARTLVKIAQNNARNRQRNKPATVLASGVAAALAHARQPLAKSRDGVFGQVLAQVWYAVDPGNAPEDMLPYLQPAADFVRRTEPMLSPRKGRKGK